MALTFSRWRHGLWAPTALPLAYLMGALAVPQLLAFPYSAQIGGTEVLAERPIDRAAMAQVLARSDRLLAASPLADAPVGRRIILTDGGWRWTLLALSSRHGYALTRPVSDVVSDAVILNRSDAARDDVKNGIGGPGRRSLSGTITHERTHMLIRRRFGFVAAALLPQWKAEGYPDYVAQESSLSDADVARLRAAHIPHPAIAYYEGRRRVAAILARNGGDVEALLRE